MHRSDEETDADELKELELVELGALAEMSPMARLECWTCSSAAELDPCDGGDA